MENAHHNKLIFVVLINIFQGILVLTLYFLLWKIIEQELFGCFWLHCSFITSAENISNNNIEINKIEN